MAELTAGALLQQVDGLLSNGYRAEEKLRWLSQAEGFVRTAVYGMEGEVSLSEEDVLMAPAPYQELYRYYVEAQIHYCNGEMTRYNNAAAMWNNVLLTLRDAVNRAQGRSGTVALKFT